ncbi:MAG: hypothetical protein LBQ49_00525 [Rickettsiales bacterium]|jgi:hypothetical protein|nr:hypothetical protein [Rickettsiales bacterium]
MQQVIKFPTNKGAATYPMYAATGMHRRMKRRGGSPARDRDMGIESYGSFMSTAAMRAAVMEKYGSYNKPRIPAPVPAGAPAPKPRAKIIDFPRPLPAPVSKEAEKPEEKNIIVRPDTLPANLGERRIMAKHAAPPAKSENKERFMFAPAIVVIERKFEAGAARFVPYIDLQLVAMTRKLDAGATHPAQTVVVPIIIISMKETPLEPGASRIEALRVFELPGPTVKEPALISGAGFSKLAPKINASGFLPAPAPAPAAEKESKREKNINTVKFLAHKTIRFSKFAAWSAGIGAAVLGAGEYFSYIVAPYYHPSMTYRGERAADTIGYMADIVHLSQAIGYGTGAGIAIAGAVLLSITHGYMLKKMPLANETVTPAVEPERRLKKVETTAKKASPARKTPLPVKTALAAMAFPNVR